MSTDDLFDDGLGEDDGDSGTAGSQDNKSFAELRKAYNRAERERKALAGEIEELRTFRAEVVGRETEAKIQSVFEEVGLNPQHSKLFKALNPDVGPDGVTADAVAAFANEYALITTSGDTVDAPAPVQSGFNPVTVGTGPKVGKLTSADVKEMLDAGDTDGVAKAIREGRVQKEPVPWTVV